MNSGFPTRLSESDTRAKLIDPALHARDWTEDLIRREETAGAIEILEGKPRKRTKGKVDYTLRIKVNADTQPVAVALIEAKAEHLPPTHGLEQAKLYAACKRLNVPFVFTLEEFRARWIVPPQRKELLERLPDAGRSALLVQKLEEMTDYDLYDVLAELAYGLASKTRGERAGAFGYKHANWLGTLPPATRDTLIALTEQFGQAGTEGLENPHIFELSAVKRAGGLAALKALGKPASEVLLETKERLFAS